MSQTTDENPFVKPTEAPDLDLSIISTILDLDELMSAEVKRAERMVPIYLRPDLEAQIDTNEAEHIELVGPDGEVPTSVDASLADTDSVRAFELAELIQATRREYAASARNIRLRQLPSDDWEAFREKHQKTLEAGAPFPSGMWNELIAASAAQPPLGLDQVVALRSKLGAPTMDFLANASFELNTRSGVSVPKSPLSSLVLKQREPETS